MTELNERPYTWAALGDILQARRTSFDWRQRHEANSTRTAELRILKRLMKFIDGGVEKLTFLQREQLPESRAKFEWAELARYLLELRGAVGGTTEEMVCCFLDAVLAPVLEEANWKSAGERALFLGRVGRLPIDWCPPRAQLKDFPGVKEKLKVMKKRLPGTLSGRAVLGESRRTATANTP